MDFNLYVIIKWLPELIQGLKMTLLIFFISCIFSILIGILISTISTLKIPFISKLMKNYITIFRNIPLLVLLFFLFFGLPDLNITLSIFMTGVVGITLNESAFIAEIMRGSIQSIDEGQWEAGYSIAFTKFQVFKNIIFPQAIRDAIPAITGQTSIILKDTSVLSLIMISELTNISNKIYTYETDTTGFLFVAAIYIALYWLLNSLSRILEKRVEVRR